MRRRELLGAIASPLAGQITFEEYNPKSTLKVPGREIKRSKFPHIDIHNHQDGMMSAAQLAKLVNDMDAPDDPKHVATMLERSFREGVQGRKPFKNFGMFTRDGNGKRIPADDKRWFDVFEVCAQCKAPVLIHSADPKPFWDPWDKNNKRWLELKEYPSRRRSACMG